MLRMRLSLYCGCVAVATQVGLIIRFTVITHTSQSRGNRRFRKIRLNMDALHPLLRIYRRLGLKLEQDPATAFRAAARNEARARDPVAHPLELSNRINPAAITAAGGKAVAVPGDVSKSTEAQGIIEAASKTKKNDILVNNSGVYEYSPLEAITEGHFHRHFNINVLGLLLVTQAAVKYLGEGGSIITWAPLPVASHLRTARFTPALRPQSTPSPSCCPASSAQKDPGQHPQSRHSRD